MALNHALAWIEEQEKYDRKATGKDREYTELEQLLEQWLDAYHKEENKQASKKKGKAELVVDEELVRTLMVKLMEVYTTPKWPAVTLDSGESDGDRSNWDMPIPRRNQWK
ncbi:hypothetical protein M427DRAFT_29262 [Gonapodya prolifera JEL478]|uniref:Uncharacterized protein n=1 Tax=Gonapodya prolifera (strain JEL478) TaxID=1344416 RepID=A0A139ARG8_GONPJ|nr:hypothetical protein M427DRAFT_29262 [Gonapodya prolifera JEL478]|eukprot:KXS19350.1 hypothetical protein M427DRAFT_29262 [Gonapodya prolifera JEL478]